MAAPPVDPELLSIFGEEVEESLAVVREHLLRIEQGADDALERHRDVLRLAHDLKGSARIVGLVHVGHLAHALETQLKTWRPAERVDASSIDLALRASDLISELTVHPDDAARAERAAALGAQLSGEASPSARPSAAAASPETGRDRAAVPDSPGGVVTGFDPAIGAAEAALQRHGDTIRVERVHMDELSQRIAGLRVESQTAAQTLTAMHEALIELEEVVYPYDLPGAELLERARRDLRAHFMGLSDDLRAVTRRAAELGFRVRKLSLISVSKLATFIERVARDAAKGLGREVVIEVEGADQLLDAQLLQALKGPLTHMVRNAVDHGIEDAAHRERVGKPRAGRLQLAFEQAADRVRVTVEDDGRGIDRAALRRRVGDDTGAWSDEDLFALLLRPGMTTRTSVTEFSGRGIGLDAVAAEVSRLAGRIEIGSQERRGTRVTLDLPSHLAVLDGMVVRASGVDFIVPFADLRIAEPREPRPDDLRLVDVLGLRERLGAGEEPGLVVAIGTGGGDARVVVDDIVDRREVSALSLGAHVGRVRCVQGAATQSIGRPALVLDSRELVDLVRTIRRRRRRPRLLVVDDSSTARRRIIADLERGGFDVVEAGDGLQAQELLASTPVDAVVSDVQMPHCDGFQLLAAVGERWPVVLSTSCPSPEGEDRAREFGALAYFPKDESVGERIVRVLRQQLVVSEEMD